MGESFDLNALMSSFGKSNQSNNPLMFGMGNTNMFNPDGAMNGNFGIPDFGNMFDGIGGATDLFGAGSGTVDNLGNGFGAAQGMGAGADGGMFDWLNSDTMGKFSTGLDAAQNLFSLYAGMKGLGFAEDRNDLMKTNLNNQSNLTNERLGTRQATRLRSQGITGDANAQAVADFMKQYAVKGA